MAVTEETKSAPADGGHQVYCSILVGTDAVRVSGGVHVQSQSRRWAAQGVLTQQPPRMRRQVGMALEVKKTLTPRARSRVSKPPRINPVVIPLLALLALMAGVLFWHFCPRHTTLARKPGQFVPDFQLIDVRTRQPNRLSDHRGNVVVVVFVGTNCPVGDLYMPRLVELAGLYETQAVDFLAINSNESESIDEIAEHGRRSGVTFPILKDPENRVADRLLAVADEPDLSEK